jgi:nitroimidazol reductase NimA-like FMN-containing flavoprotein (pyridoxamine 5'-phosphate oxidase superfamily)
MEISEDARNILERPLLAVIATTRDDGTPHSVPVWFRFDGSEVHIWTGEFGWGKNARARPQVALTVSDTSDHFAGAVILRGTARFNSGESDSITEEIRRIAGKYLEPEKVDPYLARFPHLRTIATIKPTFVRAWATAE